MDLIKYDKMCQEVSDITQISRGKEYRDKAIGIEAYAKVAKNKDLEANAWEIRLRCERKIGELMKKNPTGKAVTVNGQCGFQKNPHSLKGDGIDKSLAHRARRLWEMPYKEFTLMIADGRKEVEHSAERSALAKIIRSERHRRIAGAALSAGASMGNGPFPLIYADPPWSWGHFGDLDNDNEKGKARTPDQHYPTLSYSEIEKFTVKGKSIAKIAHKDAALFLWCTSANLPYALNVIKAWDFEYKTHAVWVKDKTGLGLVFRNQHEVLLYGTRGRMPGPQFQPSSVFLSPRTKHSVKPDLVRKTLEKMYPDFSENTRLELFGRERVRGWSVHGFESGGDLAA